MKKTLAVLSLLLLLVIGLLAHRRLTMGPATGLGVHNGALAACPNTPNCISTAATDEGHRVEPLALDRDPAAAMARLRQIVEQTAGARIVNEEDLYLHAEATSPIWGYIDDLEVWIHESEQTIHLRSASRTGYSDLGANRRRIDALIRAYGESPSP